METTADKLNAAIHGATVEETMDWIAEYANSLQESEDDPHRHDELGTLISTADQLCTLYR